MIIFLQVLFITAAISCVVCYIKTLADDTYGQKEIDDMIKRMGK